MNLKGKTALVTGGSDGLGLSITRTLVERGAKVVVCARGEDKLNKVQEELPEVRVVACDIAKLKAVQVMINKLDQVDILINCAGVWFDGQLEDHTEEQINQLIDINLKGSIYTCKSVLPQMKKRNEGYILNVSSTSGLKGKPNHAVYVASKFGVTGLTKSLQIDLDSTKIKVAGFYPGGMKTRLFKKGKSDLDVSNWMDTDKVAEIVVFMIERDETMIMDHVVLNKKLL